MKRIVDLILASGALIFLSPLLIAVAILNKLTSKGPVLYWCERVGQNGKMFYMPKFRTMCTTTPRLPTAELESPDKYLTPLGPFLRRTSIDELPQLYCVLKGDMSIVGPRPLLRTERGILRERKRLGVTMLKPGLTGWAQINGRDNVSLEDKVKFDLYYLENQSFFLDIKIIFKTAIKVLWDSDVVH